MPKARVLVEGNVQGVGYRALVKQVARRMKIKGKVKNLDDGTIELYCEADRGAIEKFLNAIDKKSRDPDDIFSLNVEKMSVCYEGENGYVPPDKEPGIFEIDYGEEAVSAFEKSNLERLEIGTLILSDVSGKQDSMLEKQDIHTGRLDSTLEKQDSMLEKQDSMLEKQDSMLEKQDSMLEKQDIHTGKLDSTLEKHDKMIEKIEVLTENTNDNFSTLNERYGVISEDSKSIKENIQHLTEAIVSLVEMLKEKEKRKRAGR